MRIWKDHSNYTLICHALICNDRFRGLVWYTFQLNFKQPNISFCISFLTINHIHITLFVHDGLRQQMEQKTYHTYSLSMSYKEKIILPKASYAAIDFVSAQSTFLIGLPHSYQSNEKNLNFSNACERRNFQVPRHPQLQVWIALLLQYSFDSFSSIC